MMKRERDYRIESPSAFHHISLICVSLHVESSQGGERENISIFVIKSSISWRGESEQSVTKLFHLKLTVDWKFCQRITLTSYFWPTPLLLTGHFHLLFVPAGYPFSWHSTIVFEDRYL